MLIRSIEEYAVRACCYIAKKGGCVSTKEISEEEKIPRPYLLQIGKLLRDGRIIISKRGPYGGYILTKAASELSIGEIFEAVSHRYCVSKKEKSRKSTKDIMLLYANTISIASLINEHSEATNHDLGCVVARCDDIMETS